MRLLMFIAAILCLNTVEAQRLYSEVGDIYENQRGLLLITLNLGLSMN